MATFTDSTGDEWTLRLTAAAVGRVRTDAGVTLTAATFLEQLGKLYDDEPDRFGNLLWVLCRKQAEGRSLAEAEFADRLDGPTLQVSLPAVLDALADFYLTPAAATAFKTQMAATFQARTEAAEEALKNFAGDSPASPG